MRQNSILRGTWPLIALLSVVCTSSVKESSAQTPTGFCYALGRILADMPNQLKGITGQFEESDDESRTYDSLVEFSGYDCSVVLYKSPYSYRIECYTDDIARVQAESIYVNTASALGSCPQTDFWTVTEAGSSGSGVDSQVKRLRLSGSGHLITMTLRRRRQGLNDVELMFSR